MQLNSLARTALCIALLTSFTACGKRADMASESKRAESPVMAAPAAAPAPARAGSARGLMAESDNLVSRYAGDLAKPAAPAEIQAQLSSSAVAPSFTDGERKFIRTAQVHFGVKDVYQSALSIEDAVAGQGGFVVNNSIGSSVQRKQRRPISDGKVSELTEYVVNGNLTVRVPSKKTQDFLRSIAVHVAFLDHRTFNARDAQFDLLRQQLEAKRNQETQEELGAATKDGGKLSHKTEAIATRNETKAARDRARVAQKEFEDQIEFSTIQLSIYQLPAVRETEVVDIDELFRQNRPAFGSRIAVAFRSGWTGMLDLLVGFAGVWPLWIVLAAAAAAVRGVLIRRRRSKTAAPATA
jgi:hypothetical protein